MQKNFSPFSLKNKTVKERSLKGYKVFSSATESIFVEASTATEAMQKSGIENPFKILPAGVIKKSLFEESEVLERQNGVISSGFVSSKSTLDNPLQSAIIEPNAASEAAHMQAYQKQAEASVDMSA